MRIFLSYRRDDLAAHSLAGRIQERLAERFGADSVFLDEHAIPPGADFRQIIKARLASCDIVFALIGPQWSELMRARQADAVDNLRIELETALAAGLKIVPVLVAGASIPSVADLPQSLAQISFLNGRRIDPGPHFHDQLNRLLYELGDRPGNKRRLLLAGAAGLAALGLGLGFFLSPWSPKGSPSKLSVVVVMGENVDYEKIMRRSFIEHLRAQLAARNILLDDHPEIVPKFATHYASPLSEAGKPAWEQVVARIRSSFSKGTVDYFVTLGTFASVAVRDSGLITELGAKGMIYLGVTDPERAGLIDRYKIAGVRYGTGGKDFGRKIVELFPPNQRLVFVYESLEGNIQDKAIAADLESLNSEIAAEEPQARSPRFEIQPISKAIEIADLKLADPERPSQSPVYFAWYGLDNILSQESTSSLGDKRLWIIPSTYSPRNFNLAGLIVSVDDKIVGRLGAEIVLKHVDNPDAVLQKERVRAPGFRVWINKDRIEEKGIKLHDRVVSRHNDPSYSYDTAHK